MRGLGICWQPGNVYWRGKGRYWKILYLYRSICRGWSWLDMVRGEAEKESDARATTDS